jgi:antitoxin component of MazEF toxin-antitoxin module
MITKQRKVGSSMVLTVPKEFACTLDAEKKPQYYEASINKDGIITYSPVEIRVANLQPEG